jgi:ribosome-associated toxin RatA of RatAB toxin-antitoxin module
MGRKTRMILSAPAVFVLTSASTFAWAGTAGLPVLPMSPSSDSDGYSMAAPQAVAAGDKLQARIEARTATNCSNAWQVFTDFDAMPRFLPGMEASKILSREGRRVTVQQRGRHQYGIFSKRYESERELTMNEPALIESRSLPGDEMAIASSTSFTPTQSDGCAIAYSATIGLPAWVPRVTAIGFVKSLAITQMQAMLAEVKRRYLPALPAAKAQAWRLAPDARARFDLAKTGSWTRYGLRSVSTMARPQGKEMSMACRSTVESKDLRIETRIGTYEPADTAPDAHILDMTLRNDR